MSFFDDVLSKASDTLTAAGDALTAGINPITGDSNSLLAEYASVLNDESQKVWSINGRDWGKVFSYRFTVVKRNENNTLAPNQAGPLPPALQTMHFALPIPPSQMVTKPILPGKVTATVGGVVEEISAVKFWTINMSGTTGTAPSRTSEEFTARSGMSRKFRDVIKTTGTSAGAFAGAQSIINRVGGVADTVIDTVDTVQDLAANQDILGTATAAASGIVGSLNEALVPPLPYSASAVDGDRNGYTEAQELQKFLYMYYALKEKSPKTYELYFYNFKTDQRFRVHVQDFSLQQSAQNPHLYRYNITLKGWDVSSTSFDFDGGRDAAEFDRFGPNGDLQASNLLSPGGIVRGFRSILANTGISDGDPASILTSPLGG